MIRPQTLALSLLLATFALPVFSRDLDARFDAAVERLSRTYFAHLPEGATYLGLDEAQAPGAASRLMDRSRAGHKVRVAALEAALAELLAVDASSLDASSQVTHATLALLVEGMLAPARAVDYGSSGESAQWYLVYPIAQNSGPTVDVPDFLISQHPVGNALQAEQFLARLGAVESVLDGALENFRHSVSVGAMPPDFIFDRSIAVVEAFLEPAAAENPIYLAFLEKLDAAKIESASVYAARALEIIDAQVIPAYRRIGDYLVSQRDKASHEAGLWRLPNGEALYAAMIRQYIDSNADPEHIHRTGLAEVERILGLMDGILRAEGYTEGTVGVRMQRLNREPRFIYANNNEGRAELLADVNGHIQRMYAELPRGFRAIPPYPVEVHRIPEFRQASAPLGYYSVPTPEGSRPGMFFINLRDTAEHPRWTLPSLTFHETVPGHHLDSATSISRDVPALVKLLYSNTSSEGWALYSERLAAEMGLYADDPFGDLGRLQAELHRAVRLVVDTGMHAKRWSRERAIEYMVSTEGLDEGTAVAEIERFVVWPGQALGYKLGQLNILALREEARAALGEDFDIRDFNQLVLGVASAPMPFIQRTVREWILRSKAGGGRQADAA
ncbi:DUF885 domain-containing protein [Mangrovimicrobium sediminis]|uniref:DUF885 domain-containing protein n=1 Tax=Mangrovimicrobium sediminis TaxID=2562682 RepID=UPI001436A37D|nr:DUF885 domain-containing protein [Haliea sp. SAOS-164]